MPALQNQKHEAFAKQLAKGKSASQSYIDAGYRPCRQNASRLSSHDDIRARVTEIQETQPTPAEIKKIDGRDAETGRFLMGHSAGGRPRGSRNKLATEFIDAVYQDFQKNGAAAIKKVAAEKPAEYLRLIAQVLPKELDIALNVSSDLFQECRDFAAAFRLAQQVIGADIEDDEPLLIEAEAESDA